MIQSILNAKVSMTVIYNSKLWDSAITTKRAKTLDHSSIEPDEAELFGAEETETRLYFPQMCMMNTDPMNINDNTKTGTGPILLKIKLKKIIKIQKDFHEHTPLYGQRQAQISQFRQE